MNPEAMEQFGKALRAFSKGEQGAAGWKCEVVHAEKDGEYLARLTRQQFA